VGVINHGNMTGNTVEKRQYSIVDPTDCEVKLCCRKSASYTTGREFSNR